MFGNKPDADLHLVRKLPINRNLAVEPSGAGTTCRLCADIAYMYMYIGVARETRTVHAIISACLKENMTSCEMGGFTRAKAN